MTNAEEGTNPGQLSFGRAAKFLIGNRQPAAHGKQQNNLMEECGEMNDLELSLVCVFER